MMQWTQLSSTDTWIVLLISIAVWLSYSIFIILKKTTREGIIRSGLFAIALTFICLLFFKPMLRLKKLKGTAILLTEDVDVFPDSLPVFALPFIKPHENVIQVPDLLYIERNHPEINNLYIKGYNLDPAQLKLIQGLNLKFLKDDIEGFTWLSYNRNLIEGEKLKVSGTYKNDTPDTVKLELIAAAGPIDSTFITPGKTRSFSMQGSVEFPGSYIGNIEILKNGILVREPLPYTISPATPINVMILQAFPSFEINVLKEWLAEQQHRVQVNVQISRDNYAVQFINQESKGNMNFLSAENLNDVDILIGDAERIRKFRNIEKESIQKAVNNGLGLLVFADEKTVNNPKVLSEDFQMVNSSEEFILKGASKKKNLKLKKLPVSIKKSIEVVPVLESENQNISFAYIPKGRGRIALQLITETFPLVLQGEKNVYHSYWTEILNAVSRRNKVVEVQLIELPFIWQKEMAQLDINDTTMKQIRYSDGKGSVQNLFPKIDLKNPYVTSFNFLPVRSGWFSFNVNSDKEIFEYVMPNDSWNDLRKIYRQRKINKIHNNDSNFKIEEYAAFEGIPLFWWYLGFICAIGFLWWREKK